MLEKAKIIIHGENSDTTVKALFNPEQYDLSRSVNYAKLSVPGLDNPILQFINGQQTTLTVSLQFDTQNDYVPSSTSNDVRDLTKPIMKAVRIDGNLHAPPAVTFNWGNFSFSGVITDVKQSFTMFLPSGMPVRSKMDLTFQYNENSAAFKQDSTFESPDLGKIKYSEQGFDLWRLAYLEYGDAGMWRNIANANGIDNPLKCQSGLLKIPPI